MALNIATKLAVVAVLASPAAAGSCAALTFGTGVIGNAASTAEAPNYCDNGSDGWAHDDGLPACTDGIVLGDGDTCALCCDYGYEHDRGGGCGGCQFQIASCGNSDGADGAVAATAKPDGHTGPLAPKHPETERSVPSCVARPRCAPPVFTNGMSPTTCQRPGPGDECWDNEPPWYPPSRIPGPTRAQAKTAGLSIVNLLMGVDGARHCPSSRFTALFAALASRPSSARAVPKPWAPSRTVYARWAAPAEATTGRMLMPRERACHRVGPHLRGFGPASVFDCDSLSLSEA